MANTASGALKAVVMAEYIALLLPRAAFHTTEIALVSVSFFALLQLAGIRAGSKIQQSASAGFGLIMKVFSAKNWQPVASSVKV